MRPSNSTVESFPPLEPRRYRGEMMGSLPQAEEPEFSRSGLAHATCRNVHLSSIRAVPSFCSLLVISFSTPAVHPEYARTG